MAIRSGLLAVACAGLLGCASPSPSPSPTSTPTEATIQIRFTPGDFCPSAALQLPLTFRIDAAADEDVIGVTATGTRYHVWWSEGFTGGTARDAVVRDRTGQVVARAGEVLRGYTLHGHTVCATGNSIYVLRDGPP